MLIYLELLFSFILFFYSSSEWAFHKYETNKAKEILNKEFCKNHFWMQSDDKQGKPYFISKKEFKKSGKLKVIPVLKLSKGFHEFDYSQDIRYYFEVDYSQFCGLIYKDEKFLDVMFVFYAYNRKEKLVPIASIGYKPEKFYESYRQKSDSIFYDSVIHSFCFFENDNLYTWSERKGQFISYKQMIESEKYGLRTFKEIIQNQ